MPSSPANEDCVKSNAGTTTEDLSKGDVGSSTTFRDMLGRGTTGFSDLINEHLIVFRYFTISSVFLLGAYGMANTPLFYRYKNVVDISTREFNRRRWIHGRLVAQRASAPTSSPQGDPIVLYFRHSSPIERMLTTSAMSRVIAFTGRSESLLYTPTNPHRNLLPVELAGVASPPLLRNGRPSILCDTLTGSTRNTASSIDGLINGKVSVQLLAQRDAEGESDEGHTAICHLRYTPSTHWFQSVDLGLQMVRKGQACISTGTVVPLSGGENEHDAKQSISCFDPTVKQLQDDSNYMTQLEEAEYEAWKSRVGMWSSDEVRKQRKEYVEEEEESSSKWSTIIWSWMNNRMRRS